jgi:ATP-binding cassette subfamily C protein
MASVRLLQSVKKINMSVNQLSYSKSSLDLVSAEISDIKNLNLLDSKKDRSMLDVHFSKKVELKGMSYKYPDLNKKILNNIDVEFEKNTCTAIVGHSGSGKTTLVNVFLNLLTASEGAFLVDGSKYKDLSVLKNNIGYVPQSVYITDDSIEHNIAFGVNEDEIEHDRVISSLKLSHLYDFVSSLPDGVSTLLGENGARLSGGQKQRLGIARALYNDPDIIVFDEMTASLDGNTEFRIMREIFNMAKMKTIVIITHKINTIKSCDKIYLLESGKIEDVGNYHELYEHNNKFREMADGHTH